MKSRYSNCSIIIPVYNEEETIGDLLEEIINLSLFEEIIVVNDFSTDSSKKIIQGFSEVTLINNHVNMGNGSSVKKGILKSAKEYIVVLDADGQHPPKAIKRLVDYTIENDYDLVVASRKSNKNISGFRTFGNKVLEAFASYLSGEKIYDLTSGFRVFKRSSMMKIIHLFPKRYSYPTTSVLGLNALGYTVGYLEIPEIKPREKGKSGINPLKDFFRFMRMIFKIAIVFGPAKVFVPISAFLFAVGFINIGMTVYIQGRIQEFGVITIILSMLMGAFALLGEQLARIRIEIGVTVANEIENSKRASS